MAIIHTIERDGKTITLTNEEILAIRQKEHAQEHRYAVEDALAECEEDGLVSFASWASNGYADYASEEDARADFIEYVVEHILDMEDSEERCPPEYRWTPDYNMEVLDSARDLDYLTEEE